MIAVVLADGEPEKPKNLENPFFNLWAASGWQALSGATRQLSLKGELKTQNPKP